MTNGTDADNLTQARLVYEWQGGTLLTVRPRDGYIRVVRLGGHPDAPAYDDARLVGMRVAAGFTAERRSLNVCRARYGLPSFVEIRT